MKEHSDVSEAVGVGQITESLKSQEDLKKTFLGRTAEER